MPRKGRGLVVQRVQAAVDGFGENRELVTGQSPDHGLRSAETRASRSLSVSSTRSPVSCPKVSFTSLKLSTSTYSSARPLPWRWLRVIDWCSRCWNCMRFGILVSVSKRAR